MGFGTLGSNALLNPVLCSVAPKHPKSSRHRRSPSRWDTLPQEPRPRREGCAFLSHIGNNSLSTPWRAQRATPAPTRNLCSPQGNAGITSASPIMSTRAGMRYLADQPSARVTCTARRDAGRHTATALDSQRRTGGEPSRETAWLYLEEEGRAR
jgi:hypothetical protein